MSEMILFLQVNRQMILTGIFWLVMLILFVNQLRLLHRTKKLQRKLDGITDSVREYLAVVMEPETGEKVSESIEKPLPAWDDGKEERDSRLISSVLQEIFP